MEYIYLVFLIIIVFILALLYQRLIASRQKLVIKILPVIFLLATPLWLAINPAKNEPGILNPVSEFIDNSINQIDASSQMEKIVLNELENTEGTYAVAIKNLETNEYYFLNENREFDSASLYKLWVMAATYKEIENGNLSLDQNIGFDASTINERLNIASESAEITGGFVGNTVEGAISRMITVSDNYSAHILYLTIGWNKVEEFLSEYNLNDSSTDSVTTTTNDILKYYELLYKGEIVSESASNEMLEILKRQELNDRIPKYLPENTTIAHKTGELGAVKHDAGIVYSPNGDYIIVLMSETADQTTATEIEAGISEKVWEYFN